MSAPAVALVLGAGQIGTAVAKKLKTRFDVHLHCRRFESALAAASEVGIPHSRLWHGDLFFGSGPLFGPRNLPIAVGENEDDLFDGSIARTRLAAILDASRPQIVIDATNIATMAARVSATLIKEGPATTVAREWASIGVASHALQGQAIALHQALRSGQISSYIKVSTTGLGSRGLEVPFTHGDHGQFMSRGLWKKLFLAGTNHQLLWALARTFPRRVAVVVPAAFVGFEGYDFYEDDCASARAETVGAGEEKDYTAAELAVISSKLQMGTVTREEVAQAVFDIVCGSSVRFDLISAMNSASMTSSSMGARAREIVLSHLSQGRPLVELPIVNNSLGFRTNRALLAIRFLRRLRAGSLSLWQGDDAFDHVPDVPEIPFDLVQLAELHGVKMTTDHARATNDRSMEMTCVCGICVKKFAMKIREILNDRSSLSENERVAVDLLLSTTDWNEGDLLALLWAGKRAEYYDLG